MNIDFKLSKHCTEERIDRLTFIMTHTGLGDTLCEYQKSDHVLYRLTTTGVLMIIDPCYKALVTAYYVNPEKATAIIRSGSGNQSCSKIYKVIKQNKGLIEQQNKAYSDKY